MIHSTPNFEIRCLKSFSSRISPISSISIAFRSAMISMSSGIHMGIPLPTVISFLVYQYHHWSAWFWYDFIALFKGYKMVYRECRKIPIYGTSYRVQCLSMSMLVMLVDVAYRSRQPISCGSRLILLSFDNPFQKLQNSIKISGEKGGQSINARRIPLKNPDFIGFWLILSHFDQKNQHPDWK